MSSVTRIGLIGAGGIGKAYLEALADCASVKVVGVADENVDLAEEIATGLGARAYRSHRALAEDGRCDAALVCTPPVTHDRICRDLLRVGMPVLCEKPFALDAGEARSLAELAQEQDTLLTMASKFRYVDDVVRTRSIMESGLLGDILLIENAFTSPVSMRGRWNADPAVSGGGVLIDNGTHSVDVLRYLMGPLARVHAVEGVRTQALPVEDTAQMFVESLEGVRGVVDLSWSLSKDRSSYLEVHGTEGVIRTGWTESRYRQRGSSEWTVFGRGYRKHDALRAQVENFCSAVAGEEPLRITTDDAIASVEVVQAAYASLGRSTWEVITSEVGHGLQGNGHRRLEVGALEVDK
jgi:predicted dehydrogenase